MKYTLYTRISTQQQGAIGLGLEAQRAAVLCVANIEAAKP